MGGHLLVLVASELDAFSRLILLDPIIVAGGETTTRWKAQTMAEHPVARRRNQWDSPQAMYDRFRGREPFSDWQDEVVQDYCLWALHKVGSHYELACPPRVEAAIYLSSGGSHVFDRIPNVPIPVQIVRGRPRTPDDPPFDFRPSPTMVELYRLFDQGSDRVLMDHTHFFPFEDPQIVVGLIVD